jgi:hypothetical protein
MPHSTAGGIRGSVVVIRVPPPIIERFCSWAPPTRTEPQGAPEVSAPPIAFEEVRQRKNVYKAVCGGVWGKRFRKLGSVGGVTTGILLRTCSAMTGHVHISPSILAPDLCSCCTRRRVTCCSTTPRRWMGLPLRLQGCETGLACYRWTGGPTARTHCWEFLQTIWQIVRAERGHAHHMQSSLVGSAHSLQWRRCSTCRSRYTSG